MSGDGGKDREGQRPDLVREPLADAGDEVVPVERPDSPLVASLSASPNHDCRKGVSQADMLILHYTGMRDGLSALHRLCDPAPPRVSAHYVVFEDGEIVQCVAEERRAWHAGAGSWEGREDLNSRSIGIEIVNPGHEFGYRPFPEAQIEAVVALAGDIVARLNIAPHRVLGHSDVAPLRKQDPGEFFPWERLSAEGLGLWVPAVPSTGGKAYGPGEEGPPIQAIQALFAMLGYGIAVTGVYDGLTEAVVTAFQRHWRQDKVDGIADGSTLATLRALLERRRPGQEAD